MKAYSDQFKQHVIGHVVNNIFTCIVPGTVMLFDDKKVSLNGGGGDYWMSKITFCKAGETCRIMLCQ